MAKCNFLFFIIIIIIVVVVENGCLFHCLKKWVWVYGVWKKWVDHWLEASDVVALSIDCEMALAIWHSPNIEKIEWKLKRKVNLIFFG